ncbi:MAG: DUF1801 domain-containing protein [Gemmatimonadaceae bacterium]|nr:DUF1801 domain-containing protein [Gemmatimonadaceae bacterium]MCW5826605.1 DUF1801 domain-containing protein [Gemmatimonadaceae bacterium]
MAEAKTKPTNASVAQYIKSRATPQQAKDCKQLTAMLRRVTGKSPKMWGPSIVGFGVYTYTYATGRTGDWPVAGFAIRGKDLVVYVMAETAKNRALLPKLGKYRIGKSCLYFKQLTDVNLTVLERIVAESVAELKRRYP